MALLLLIGEFNVRTSKQHEGGMREKAVVNKVHYLNGSCWKKFGVGKETETLNEAVTLTK